MAYPSRLLASDEDVVFDLRPHPVRLLKPVLVAMVVLAGEIAGFVAFSSAPTWFGIVLLVVFVALVVGVMARVLAWRSTELVLTTRRVIDRRGVLRRSVREIPLGRIQDVSYDQHLFERLVGVGRIVIRSGARDGGEAIPDVRRPEIVQNLLNRAIEEALRPAAPASYQSAGPSSAVPELLERLAELHRRGAITKSEYDDKRAELLGRL